MHAAESIVERECGCVYIYITVRKDNGWMIKVADIQQVKDAANGSILNILIFHSESILYLVNKSLSLTQSH